MTGSMDQRSDTHTDNDNRRSSITNTNQTQPIPIPTSSTTQPRTRRSARILDQGLPDAELSNAPAQSAQASSSTVGKGKKRAQAEEIEASSSKKQTTSTTNSTDRKGKKRADPPPTDETAIAPSPGKKVKRNARQSLGETAAEKGLSKIGEKSSKGKKPAKKMPRRPAAKGRKSGGPSGSDDKSKKGDNASRNIIDNSLGDVWGAGGSGSGGLGVTDDEFDDDMRMDEDEDDDDDEDEGDDDDDEDGAENGAGNPYRSGLSMGGPGGMASRLAQLASETGMHLDEATAAAIFGGGFRSFGGMSSGLAGRFKRLRGELTSSNASTRHSALRECSELLLVSNEDTLGGAFSITTFATEFIAILDGRPNINPDAPTEVVRPPDEMDEDAQLAAALAMSAGEELPSGGGNVDEMETQLVACRCLAHLMEALPGSGHTLVALGAVPVLCSKLNEISYIELAEQTLSTMEKISSEHPSAVVKEGGLGALLNYLDFFSTNVQRTAVTAAANCCRNISSENYTKIRDVFPTLRQTLTSTDQRLVESATLAVVRTIEAYRHTASHLEGLLDLPTVVAINSLLMPSGGSPLLSPATYTHLLRSLTGSARGSAKVTINFLEAGMTSTVYQILTGVLPPSHDEDEQGSSSGGQGLSGGIADMAVLQNLAHRPKDQVEEALALIVELLPPLPRDGVFDYRNYSERALNKMKQGARSGKKPRRSSRTPKTASTSMDVDTSADTTDADVPTGLSGGVSGESTTAQAGPSAPAGGSSRVASGFTDYSEAVADLGLNIPGMSKDAVAKVKKQHERQTDQRLDLLKEHPDVVARFVKTILPVLVDVYAASVAVRVRSKVLMGLAKAVAFTDAESLKVTLRSVPMASFLGTIISSETNAQFVQSALQLVELLVNKLPDVYQTSFIREGVVYEIEKLAETETEASKKAVKAEENTEDIKPSLEQLALAGPSVPSNITRQVPAFPSVLAGSRTADLPEYLRDLLAAEGMSGSLASMMSMASKKAAPTTIDVDTNIWRARVLGAKKIFDVEGDDKNEAKLVLDKLSALNGKLSKQAATEAELYDALKEIASQFSSAGSSLSSFELLRGGVIDGLLQFVDIDGTVSSAQRRSMLYEIFAETAPTSSASPMTILVKRLHESLGRLESFDVESAFNGVADASRPTASALSRTLRVRLSAEPGQDIPKSISQLVLTIQAIAPLSALHDYLRPRVADGGGSGSALARMLAAGGMSGSGPSGGSLMIPGSGGRMLDIPGRQGAQASSSTAPAPGLSSSAPQNTGPPPPLGSSRRPPAPASAPKTRRRSARLSAQHAEPEVPEATQAAEASNSTSSSTAAPANAPLSSSAPAPSNLPIIPLDMEFDDDEYSDEEFGDEMFENEMAAAALSRSQEKVVNMNVTSDGSRIEVKTPEGTRVATPSGAPPTGSSSAAPAATPTGAPGSGGSMTPRTASYAGAVKTAPTDFHLTFHLDGKQVDIRDTVYGIVHKYHQNHSTSGASVPFGSSVNLMWRKVDGPAPTDSTDKVKEEPDAAPSPSSAIPSESPTNKILRLLKVVHTLTDEARSVSPRNDQMNETLFVNNKLTAKLTRQLEEVMILASGCLPDWATELPRNYAFLFPFETRYSFLQSTSFGYARLIAKHMTAHQANTRNSRRFDDLSHLARITRQKVRISRAQLLESCAKVMQLYGNTNGILEVEYFDEIGTGLGPTLEFYSQSSLQIARRDIKLWRDEDETKPGEYVFHPKGLFPAPISWEEGSIESSARLHWFNTLGLFIGRALLDSRIIDLNINKVALQLILGMPVKQNIATLKLVDEQLARSLERLQSYLNARKEIEALPLAPEARSNKLLSLTVGGAQLSDLSLDFTVPGYGIELKPGGAQIDVDDSNLEEYLTLVLDMTLGSGIAKQVKSLQTGFSTIMPIDDLRIFSPEEIGLLIGNADEDWSKETLESVIKADHGYNLESRAVKNLIDVMSSYTKEERRAFLQFITGAPKLPIGGFRGLTPPFTVVRKPHEPPFKADDYLPSVMTCAQYLKMPDYTTRDILASQIDRAIKDGGQSFHLS